MTKRVIAFAVGCLFFIVVLAACAQIIGVEDLPDNGSALADARVSPIQDAATGALDSIEPDAHDEVDLQLELMGYWPFSSVQGSVTPDLSGHGFDATTFGVRVSSSPMYPGFLFGTESANIRIGNPTELNISGDITIAAWCLPMLGDGGRTDGQRNIVAHGYSTNPQREVYLRIYDGFYQAGSWDGAQNAVSAAMPAEDLNRWVHLAVTYDGQSWNLYRDGELFESTNSTTGAVEVPADWVIGNSLGAEHHFFVGMIDEVRIYKRALSPAEVTALANTAIPGQGAFTATNVPIR